MVTLQLFLVELQGFLLGSLSGVGHIALMGLFHSQDRTDRTTTDEDFPEEAAPFLVLQTVDGEDFLAIDIVQSNDGFYLIETLAELCLVEQHHDIGVVDDGFLDNGTAYNVLNLLCHHTYTRPELSGCLVEVLDILCHHRGGNGFPCLFDDQHLAVLLDAHLLDEDIHDDKGDKRKQERVILYGVNLKDNEGLVKQLRVQVLIEGQFMAASLVEVFQQIVVGCQVDAGKVVLLDDGRDADSAVLVESVEREVVNAFLHKVFIEILCDDLLYQAVFRLGDFSLGSLPDKHDEILQEANLLDIQLLSLDGKGVHRDRMLIGIADILASDIFTESLIRVTRIDHDHIGVLFPHLAHYAVHVELIFNDFCC